MASNSCSRRVQQANTWAGCRWGTATVGAVVGQLVVAGQQADAGQQRAAWAGCVDSSCLSSTWAENQLDSDGQRSAASVGHRQWKALIPCRNLGFRAMGAQR